MRFVVTRKPETLTALTAPVQLRNVGTVPAQIGVVSPGQPPENDYQLDPGAVVQICPPISQRPRDLVARTDAQATAIETLTDWADTSAPVLVAL